MATGGISVICAYYCILHACECSTLPWRHNEHDGVTNHQRLDCLNADQRKHQSSASLASVRGIHRRPVNSPHKGPVTRKMFPFDDVIMKAVGQWYTAFMFIILTLQSISSNCSELVFQKINRWQAIRWLTLHMEWMQCLGRFHNIIYSNNQLFLLGDLANLKETKFWFRRCQLLWNLTHTSACQILEWYFLLEHPFSRLRDFTRFGGKTSYHLMNRGPEWHG